MSNNFQRASWRRNTEPLDERQRRTVVYMYRNGYSLSAISQRFHLADHSIRDIAEKAGLPLRHKIKQG